jgi:hypothetical protein
MESQPSEQTFRVFPNPLSEPIGLRPHLVNERFTSCLVRLRLVAWLRAVGLFDLAFALQETSLKIETKIETRMGTRQVSRCGKLGASWEGV